jgi:hypothetical protein
MNQPMAVRPVQAPRELNCDVEDSCAGDIVAASIELSAHDPLPQCSAFHELREDARDAFDAPDVMARSHVRMETEIYPDVALVFKVRERRMRLQPIGPRPFHG